MNPFSWLSYLDVADNLMSFGSEGHFRSAVSRAYSGILNETRSRIERRGVYFKRPNSQLEVIEWLRNQPHDDFVHIGIELDRLRRERNSADYNNQQTFTQSRAEKSITQARRVEKDILVYL